MNIPGCKQSIDEDDIRAVVAALNDNLLTTGPRVEEFESHFAKVADTRCAVAVNSGTAALHVAMYACEIGSPGFGDSIDEVIVPAISFVATANAVLYRNATPVFADVEHDTLRIDVQDVKRKITSRTRAIVAMDYGGQPCDYEALRYIADQHGLMLISDACHSLGGSLGARSVGSLADCSCFSLHPAKQITSGEGGVVTTDDQQLAMRMRAFRNHGIGSDHRQRQKQATHQYRMETLGFNYRLTDIQCALGLSQLSKLGHFTRRRNEIASQYDQLLSDIEFVEPLKNITGAEHARHLYVVHWNENVAGMNRDKAFAQLRRRGIGVNVHYQPIYQQSYYRDLIDREKIPVPGCTVADNAYRSILSLPIFVDMSPAQVQSVVDALLDVANSGSARSRRAA